MSDDANVVRTVFDWDVEGVLGGIREIEKAYDREKGARRKSTEEAKKGGKHGGGHGMGDLGMGVHDLLMGRGQAALGRFAGGLKVAGAYAVGMGVALEAGGKAMEYVARKTDEADSAAARLEQSLLRVSKAATATSEANGSAGVLDVFKNADEQRQGENEQLVRLGQLHDLQNSPLSWRDPTGGLYYRLKDKFDSLTGLSTDQKIDQAEMEQRRSEQIMGKTRGQYTRALGNQRDDLYDQAYGSPYQAKYHALDRQQQVEKDAAIAAKVGTPENLKLIDQRFETQRVLLAREEKAAYRRLSDEKTIAKMRLGGTDAEMRSAKVRLTEAFATWRDQTPGSFAAQQAEGAYWGAAGQVAQIGHARAQELTGAESRTAAMRLKTLGRDDYAGVVESRSESSLAIAAARFQGKNGVAENLEDQAREQQRQFLVGKYLNPDGTRRNAGAVLMEDIQRQRKAARISSFLDGTKDTDAGGGLHSGGLESSQDTETAASRALASAPTAAQRLAQAGGPQFSGTGLSHGAEKLGPALGLSHIWKNTDGSIKSAVDPLTGNTLNAREVHEHMAAAAKKASQPNEADKSDHKIFADIFTILDARLPKTTK